MTAQDAILSEQAVQDAFRLILGRLPESPEVLAFHRRARSEAALRRTLISSREFAAQYAEISATKLAQAEPSAEALAADEAKHPDERPGTSGLKLARGILPEMGPVETEIAGEAAAALWARVSRSWQAMGETAAHWSVLTHDLFKPEAFEANRQTFEGTAEVEGLLMDGALERIASPDPKTLRAIEIGCGVGRATRALARRFGHVTGLDISASHLAVAERELAAAGHENVTLRRMTRVEDYGDLGSYDAIYSRLVLQHNPPPVQAAILAQVFAGLAPGGIALFQVVTYGRHYSYSVAEDLARQGNGMEMHVLPQGEVFRLMAEGGLVPLEVQEDFAAGRDGPFRSHLFLGRKA